MTISISSTYPSQSDYTTSQASSSAVATQVQQAESSDKVTLSESAQVSQLNQQGENPSEIAKNLGITVALVDLDLGIVTTTSSTPSAAPAGAPAPKAAASVQAEATKATKAATTKASA
jgi:hypothetical protein